MYRRTASALLLVTAAAWSGAPAKGEIVSITGSVLAETTEYFLNEAHDTERVNEEYPETSGELPIQAVARLNSFSSGSDTIDAAAAAVGAQFADPRSVTSPNPEEFAINMALHSGSPDVYYTGHATSSEKRVVRFSAADLGQPAGSEQAVTVTGRLYLDGAFTIFAGDATTDATDSYVRMRVTVVKQVEGHEDETAFSGEVQLAAGADGEADVSVLGAFPTNRLVLSDLSSTSILFEVFHVLVLPNIEISYTYDARADEEFTLAAKVEVWAENAVDGAGAAAVLGTPTDSLTNVIDLTLDQQAANEFVSKLNNERANPTGKAAFESSGLAALPLSCGLFGIEMLIGMAALVGWKSRSISRGRINNN